MLFRSHIQCTKCRTAVIVPEAPAPKPLPGILLPARDAEPEEPGPDPGGGIRGVRSGSRPWIPRGREEEDEDEEEDRRPRPRSRRRRRAEEKPGKVSAIGGMLIGGGVWAIGWWVIGVIIFPLFCLWPGFYFAMIWGIFAIIRGAGLLGDDWRRHNPHSVVLYQIVQAVNLDIVNVVLGIIGMVFLKDLSIGPAFRPRYRGW